MWSLNSAAAHSVDLSSRGQQRIIEFHWWRQAVECYKPTMSNAEMNTSPTLFISDDDSPMQNV